jgi:hypothetical protein
MVNGLVPCTFCPLPFALCLLPSAFRLSPFALCPLPFALCLLPSAFCLLTQFFLLNNFPVFPIAGQPSLSTNKGLMFNRDAPFAALV